MQFSHSPTLTVSDLYKSGSDEKTKKYHKNTQTLIHNFKLIFPGTKVLKKCTSNSLWLFCLNASLWTYNQNPWLPIFQLNPRRIFWRVEGKWGNDFFRKLWRFFGDADAGMVGWGWRGKEVAERERLEGRCSRTQILLESRVTITVTISKGLQQSLCLEVWGFRTIKNKNKLERLENYFLPFVF